MIRPLHVTFFLHSALHAVMPVWTCRPHISYHLLPCLTQHLISLPLVPELEGECPQTCKPLYITFLCTLCCSSTCPGNGNLPNRSYICWHTVLEFHASTICDLCNHGNVMRLRAKTFFPLNPLSDLGDNRSNYLQTKWAKGKNLIGSKRPFTPICDMQNNQKHMVQ